LYILIFMYLDSRREDKRQIYINVIIITWSVSRSLRASPPLRQFVLMIRETSPDIHGGHSRRTISQTILCLTLTISSCKSRD
jgi:hypothetical protein